MPNKSNYRISRTRRGRIGRTRRVRRGGAEAAELNPKPPGAEGFGLFGEVKPASEDNDTSTSSDHNVMGVDQPFEGDIDSEVEQDFKDARKAKTVDEEPDGQPEPEAIAPEVAEPAAPAAPAFKFPNFFGKQEKGPPIFKDIEPPPEAAPAAAPALPAMPPALPAAAPALPTMPPAPMDPDVMMERPADSWLMGEQKVAARFPDFGLKKKRKPSKRKRKPTKKKKITRPRTLRKQITKKSRELKSLRKKYSTSKRRSKKLSKRDRKRLTKKMNEIKRRLN